VTAAGKLSVDGRPDHLIFIITLTSGWTKTADGAILWTLKSTTPVDPRATTADDSFMVKKLNYTDHHQSIVFYFEKYTVRNNNRTKPNRQPENPRIITAGCL